MRRVLLGLIVVGVVIVVVAALRPDGGPAAPPLAGSVTDCFGDVCATHPSGWEVDVGEDFLTFTHPLAPDEVLGSVGRVDMQALVESTGGSWPAPPADAVEAFFALLGDFQSASLDGDASVLADGSVAAVGELEGLRLWYRLIPVDGPAAIGIEIRAPNRSWAAQADAWRDGLVIGANP